MTRVTYSRVALLFVVVATIGCDRVTKHAATLMLAGTADRSYLADMVRLTYAENTGGFLGLGAEWPLAVRTTVFVVLTGLVLIALAGIALRRAATIWQQLGFALFLAGGALNWFDRIGQGRVVDFLNVGIGPLRTGIFNVADVALMTGVAIFAVAEYQAWRHTRTVEHSLPS
jgi:signal peptidase II